MVDGDSEWHLVMLGVEILDPQRHLATVDVGCVTGLGSAADGTVIPICWLRVRLAASAAPRRDGDRSGEADGRGRSGAAAAFVTHLMNVLNDRGERTYAHS